MSSRALTSAGLAIVSIYGFVIGLALDSAGVLILAFFAFLALLWLGVHDPARWAEPEDHLPDRKRLP